MNKKIIATFATVFVIGIISLVAVLAYSGNQGTPGMKGPNYNADVHEQMEAAIEAGDYNAWMKVRQDNNLPMNGRMLQVVNKDNFATFAKMHDAMQSGDLETAQEIRTSMGLGAGMMGGKNSVKGQNCNGGCMHNGAEKSTSSNYVDADKNGVCDNYALHHAQN